LYGKTQITS